MPLIPTHCWSLYIINLYNISNGIEEEEPTNAAPIEEEEQEEPSKEEPSEESVTEGTEGSTEPTGVEEEPTPEEEPVPEVSKDPVAEAVKEVAVETGINSDDATDAALAALGL